MPFSCKCPEAHHYLQQPVASFSPECIYQACDQLSKWIFKLPYGSSHHLVLVVVIHLSNGPNMQPSPALCSAHIIGSLFNYGCGILIPTPIMSTWAWLCGQGGNLNEYCSVFTVHTMHIMRMLNFGYNYVQTWSPRLCRNFRQILDKCWGLCHPL